MSAALFLRALGELRQRVVGPDPIEATVRRLTAARVEADPYRVGVVSCRICGEDHAAEFSYSDGVDGAVYRSTCPESDETEFYLVGDVLLPGDPT